MSTVRQIQVPLGHGAYLWLMKCPQCLALIEAEDSREHEGKCQSDTGVRVTA